MNWDCGGVGKLYCVSVDELVLWCWWWIVPLLEWTTFSVLLCMDELIPFFKWMNWTRVTFDEVLQFYYGRIDPKFFAVYELVPCCCWKVDPVLLWMIFMNWSLVAVDGLILYCCVWFSWIDTVLLYMNWDCVYGDELIRCCCKWIGPVLVRTNMFRVAVDELTLVPLRMDWPCTVLDELVLYRCRWIDPVLLWMNWPCSAVDE